MSDDINPYDLGPKLYKEEQVLTYQELENVLIKAEDLLADIKPWQIHKYKDRISLKTIVCLVDQLMQYVEEKQVTKGLTVRFFRPGDDFNEAP